MGERKDRRIVARGGSKAKQKLGALQFRRAAEANVLSRQSGGTKDEIARKRAFIEEPQDAESLLGKDTAKKRLGTVEKDINDPRSRFRASGRGRNFATILGVRRFPAGQLRLRKRTLLGGEGRLGL